MAGNNNGKETMKDVPWLRRIRKTLIERSGGRNLGTEEKQIKDIFGDEDEDEYRVKNVPITKEHKGIKPKIKRN